MYIPPAAFCPDPVTPCHSHSFQPAGICAAAEYISSPAMLYMYIFTASEFLSFILSFIEPCPLIIFP